jgi:hypothetical protein
VRRSTWNCSPRGKLEAVEYPSEAVVGLVKAAIREAGK